MTVGGDHVVFFYDDHCGGGEGDDDGDEEEGQEEGGRDQTNSQSVEVVNSKGAVSEGSLIIKICKMGMTVMMIEHFVV